MIVLYCGSRGRGKTLTMVKDAYKYYLVGYRIISNMVLPFGEYMSSSDVLKLSRESELVNCILVLDELQLFFDSRNFGRQENKSFSYFIQQIRKRNVHILGTTQYVNTVELRFRQHIDFMVYPNFDKETNICMVKYFDLTLLEDIDLDELSTLEPVVLFYDATQIFELYDTTEMLK